MSTNLVAVDYEIGHYPFFRLGGGQPGIIIIPFWGGFWEVHSTNFPDFFDLDIFLGALKLYQDMLIKGKVKSTPLYSWKDKKSGETRERKTMSIKATHLKLCQYSDLPVNGTSYKRIDACLIKLSLLTAFRVVYKKKADGRYDRDARPEEQRMMRFLNYYDTDGNKDILCFDAEFIEACVSSQLLVRYKEIHKLTSQINKALLMYIEGNQKFLYFGIPEKRIFRYFGIRAPIFPKKMTPRALAKYNMDMADYKDRTNEARGDIKVALEAFAKENADGTPGIIIDYKITKRLGTNIYEIGKIRSVKNKPPRTGQKHTKPLSREEKLHVADRANEEREEESYVNEYEET